MLSNKINILFKSSIFPILVICACQAGNGQEPNAKGAYAPINGMKSYKGIHGAGEPVVLLHGSFMTITNNWTGWIDELSKTRKVIAVEMKSQRRTGDNQRDLTY